MVSSIDTTKQKLLELTNKIKFFRDSMDHNLLICKIEQELCEFSEFQCTFHNSPDRWEYYIRTPLRHSENFLHTRYQPDRIDALNNAIKDLIL